MGKKTDSKKDEGKKDEKAKAPKLNKDGTPRAKPVRQAPLPRLVSQVTKYIKDEENAEKRAKALGKKFDGFVATLRAWGKLPESAELSASDIKTVADQLVSENFTPPASVKRVVVPDFVTGNEVQIKADFKAAYAFVYSEAERNSMRFDFFDPVNKVVMCKTDGRTMSVKLKHIEAKGSEDSADASAA